QNLEQGSFVLLLVNYGLITLINQSFDICDNLDSIDDSCPIQDSVLNITKTFKIPKISPHSDYRIKATAYSQKRLIHVSMK
ncbi:hypothetical protein B0O99DRAFT_504687, partial [Bisporella sp. PMI_857]